MAKRSDAQCASCRKAYNKQWNLEHKDYYKNYVRDPVKEKERKRRQRQKESDKAVVRASQKRYFAEHPGIRNAWDAKRRANEKQALPKWANEFFIQEAYALAKLRSKMFGFTWHVDHIVPLQSKLVCGLHVEHNLQVIPGIENSRKSNVVWPNMP